MMHLGVERKTVVLEALDNVAFPEWAGKIQGVGVQARYQYAQFPFTAGARQCRVTHVVIQIDFLVDFPARRQYPTQQPGPGKL